MKRGLIFDMDGTLWDSAENVAVSWNMAIEKNGYKRAELTTADIQGVMGKTMDVIADILFGDLGLDERRDLLAECCRMENDYLREQGGVLYPKLVETLAALKEQGWHLYIVSNCQAGYIEAFLDHYNMWGLFEDIECFGNNNLTKDKNIRLLADRNRLDINNSYYVGDIQGDYDATMAAGLKFIHAAYGFGQVAADVIRISNFEELSALDGL